jgi:hypothetical protein
VTNGATIRRCIGFAKRWGFGGIEVINLFALRATDPKRLIANCDPIGPDNEKMLRGSLNEPVMASWGGNIPNTKMAERLVEMISTRALKESGKWKCLGFTKKGDPRHPLMLSYKTELQQWP